MFVRISMWKHLILEFCFGKFNFNASKWSVQVFYFFFLILSWKTVYFRNLSISSRLSCLLAHNYANYDCISIILVITFTLKFIILFIWTFSFFLDESNWKKIFFFIFSSHLSLSLSFWWYVVLFPYLCLSLVFFL